MLGIRFYRLGLSDSDRGLRLARDSNTATSNLHSLPDQLGYRLVDGAGVSFLLGNTELRQHVNDVVGGYLQLPCQLVNSNLTHKSRQCA